MADQREIAGIFWLVLRQDSLALPCAWIWVTVLGDGPGVRRSAGMAELVVIVERESASQFQGRRVLVVTHQTRV